jgi:hypothetical protein
MRPPPSVERSSSVRSASPRILRVGLAIAFVLHALGLATVVLVQHQLGPSAPATLATPAPPQPDDPLIWFERTEEPALAMAPDFATQPEVAAIPPDSRDEPHPAEREHLTMAVTAHRSAVPPREPAAAAGSEEGNDSISASKESPEAQGTPAPETNGAAAPETPAAPPGNKRLSLNQIGVGHANNPFLAPPSSEQPSSRRRSARPPLAQRTSGRQVSASALGEHIDHVLRSALAEHDRELGLGPEGPAVAAVLDLVMQSTSAPNTDALLVLRTDGAGETLYVEVAEASGDTDAWNAIARSLLQALHGKKLRVPHGSGGVTMQLRVGSRETLPSGADPGLAIDLFGQEVKAGAGDKSTRLQLLTPKITLEQYQISPTDPHVKIPVIGFQLTILGILGDPVDIGAVARRVVHAHLVSLETHPPEPKH